MMGWGCPHLETRCLHGDEILYRMKLPLRWWKSPIVYRQACKVCGKALDRDAICTATNNRSIHTWIGKWEET